MNALSILGRLFGKSSEAPKAINVDRREPLMVVDIVSPMKETVGRGIVLHYEMCSNEHISIVLSVEGSYCLYITKSAQDDYTYGVQKYETLLGMLKHSPYEYSMPIMRCIEQYLAPTIKELTQIISQDKTQGNQA